MASSDFKDIPSKVKEEIFSNSIEIEAMKISPFTEDGSVDRKGNPAIKAATGGWKSAVILLVNYGLSTLAFFGVGVNLVLFLTRVLQQENADAANNVSKWIGTVYIFSLIGAFFQRFLLGTVLDVCGLSDDLCGVKPSGCGDGELECNPVGTIGSAIFYLSIYLTAFGNGGYQPTIATFGSDQFDEMDPSESHSKLAFFSYFYLALNVGSLFSNSVLVYYEDSGKWTIGFWTSAGSAALALLLFLLGTPGYRHFKPCGNPLTRITQVFIAAIRKYAVEAPSNGDMLYEVEGKESAIAGSRKVLHSNRFRFLDKAATLTHEDFCIQSRMTDPWKLCTVTQVEEVKSVFKILPIWLCTIIYSMVFTQMASLFVEQGATMDTNLASFHIPPASMSVFDILSVLAFIAFYRRFLIPVVRRFSGNSTGLTELHRMGIGLVIGMLAMLAAGIVELERLKRVTAPDKPSSLSILLQIPQYALIGASEVFMYVGQLEFFNGQAPDGIKSFGSSLCMASIAFGNYVSSMLISIVMRITTGAESPGWIPGNLNSGHLDRFYFLLAGLTAVDFIVYLFCAKWYGSTKLEIKDNTEEEDGENMV